MPKKGQKQRKTTVYQRIMRADARGSETMRLSAEDIATLAADFWVSDQAMIDADKAQVERQLVNEAFARAEAA